ncbi:hypothetical protein MADA3029_270046 [Vibrio nigripulchritudo MADA3029]|nr:hypothetical protein VIBNIMADA3020_420046 [Vibrio nigripulchritudo MADA3020]CCN58809.1 hypothetical protein MADA3029_270046 [Vibrio nigripulchritudo MADA3029]
MVYCISLKRLVLNIVKTTMQIIMDAVNFLLQEHIIKKETHIIKNEVASWYKRNAIEMDSITFFLAL